MKDWPFFQLEYSYSLVPSLACAVGFILSQQYVFVLGKEKGKSNLCEPLVLPGADGLLSAVRMRSELWHFTEWHFLNASHCSQRNLPPVTFFTPHFSLSSLFSTLWLLPNFFFFFNEEIHSNHFVIWTVAQQWFIYLVSPGGTVLASEGHLTLGEGALKETGWRWPAVSSLVFFFLSLFVFISVSGVVCVFTSLCLRFLLIIWLSISCFGRSFVWCQ